MNWYWGSANKDMTEGLIPSKAMVTALSPWNWKELRHFFNWRWEREVIEKSRGVIDNLMDGEFKRWGVVGRFGPL